MLSGMDDATEQHQEVTGASWAWQPVPAVLVKKAEKRKYCEEEEDEQEGAVVELRATETESTNGDALPPRFRKYYRLSEADFEEVAKVAASEGSTKRCRWYKCTLSPSCNRLDPFTSLSAYEDHYTSTHMNYECFVEECTKKFSGPFKRRLHLIEKHRFPKKFEFEEVVLGETPGKGKLKAAETVNGMEVFEDAASAQSQDTPAQPHTPPSISHSTSLSQSLEGAVARRTKLQISKKMEETQASVEEVKAPFVELTPQGALSYTAEDRRLAKREALGVIGVIRQTDIELKEPENHNTVSDMKTAPVDVTSTSTFTAPTQLPTTPPINPYISSTPEGKKKNKRKKKNLTITNAAVASPTTSTPSTLDAMDTSIDDLTASMSSLNVAPPQIRFGRTRPTFYKPPSGTAKPATHPGPPMGIWSLEYTRKVHRDRVPQRAREAEVEYVRGLKERQKARKGKKKGEVVVEAEMELDL
ncbi:hypothetical protein BC829DRAFT_441683 [Chytridium lagenaria]|nr:hypothetical protein BC829DRAFT_441683 [Chytridium lagenaria]